MASIVDQSLPYDWIHYLFNKENLVLSGLRLNNEAIISLAEALKTNQTVRSIDLSGSKIEDEGAYSLAETLRISPSIATGEGKLYLHANNISKVGINILSEAIKETSRSPECLRLLNS